METETPRADDNIRAGEVTEDLIADGKNKFAIICIRCPCVILNPGVGTFVSDKEFELPHMTQKKGTPTVEKDKISEYFKVNDMYDFENIGFSNRQEDLVYLACADCEFGPVGLSKDNVSYVAIPRVRFRFDSEAKSKDS